MPNRTGTYIAFDALGETDPTKSDFKYYSTLQMWTNNTSIDFKFVNSHEKTSAVRDSSKLETLKSRIRERLAASKNIIVILSDRTRKIGSMISFEIEEAVSRYDIPLIVTYTGYEVISNPINTRWPHALTAALTPQAKGLRNIGRAIHIPFKKEPLLAAITTFSPSNKPGGPTHVYSDKTYITWKIISNPSQYQNTPCK